MSTACVLTSAVTTHVYKQHTAACSLLVFSHHLLKQTIKNSIPQHVHYLCSHSSCYNTRLQRENRSMTTACVLKPTVTTQVYKQHITSCLLLVFSHKLLQHMFTNSIRHHVHCLCSHSSCYNRRLQTAHRSITSSCVLTPAVKTDV